jgi:hypothetical protein
MLRGIDCGATQQANHLFAALILTVIENRQVEILTR